jgi:hypothetical protein
MRGRVGCVATISPGARFLMQFPSHGQRIDAGATSPRFPEQNPSHNGLLDSSHESIVQKPFGAILVPTNRPVESLEFCIGLARKTRIPLIVVCSKRVNKDQVIKAASGSDVELYAVDLPTHPDAAPEGISFLTSTDEELLAVSSGQTRDLSTKRNLGLLIAKMLGWERLMFLDDDIYGISKAGVNALAAGLNHHNVSVLIPKKFPDNSVACHAHRLGGGKQGKFASAGGMGVRCDRDELPFFPNIYNEDWFFFADEAAGRRINKVGTSRQKPYEPYADPERARKEEFGDLLAEGLYCRLDKGPGVSDIDAAFWEEFDAAFWEEFIKSRAAFLKKVADSLVPRARSRLFRRRALEARAAQESISAAQRQLDLIKPELCQRFIELWQADLVKWHKHVSQLPHADSIEGALEYLSLSYRTSGPTPGR